MRKSPMPRKIVEQLVDSLRSQGCLTKPTDKGYWIGFPNGQSTTVHLTSSDRRAILNVRSIVKRNGCIWPFDQK